MSDIFVGFDTSLDCESWDWLSDNAPTVAVEVEKLVKLGVTPEQIRSRTLQKCGQNRVDFATRCENAARFLQASSK